MTPFTAVFHYHHFLPVVRAAVLGVYYVLRTLTNPIILLLVDMSMADVTCQTDLGISDHEEMLLPCKVSTAYLSPFFSSIFFSFRLMNFSFIFSSSLLFSIYSLITLPL